MWAALIDSMSASASVNAVRGTRTVSGATSRLGPSSSVPAIPGMRWSLTTTATSSRASTPERRLGTLGAEHPVSIAEQSFQRVEDPRLVVHERTVASAIRGPPAQGKAHGEDSAALCRTLGPELAAVLLDDLVADGEPEPGALADGLGREERVEDTADDVGRDARAGVGDRHHARRRPPSLSMVMSPGPVMAWAALASRFRNTWSICDRMHSTDGSSPNLRWTGSGP